MAFTRGQSGIVSMGEADRVASLIFEICTRQKPPQLSVIC
jgi:hypothetical protein